MFDVCTTVDTAHIDTIFKFLPHMCVNISFPVAMKNSIKVGPLVFLLKMFLITENVMKPPVLKTVKEDRNVLQTIKRRKLTGLVTSCLLKHVTE